jgi:hypothetical protein
MNVITRINEMIEELCTINPDAGALTQEMTSHARIRAIIPKYVEDDKEIIARYLKINGYDGLCCEDCGCDLDDLMPCGEMTMLCVPAYYHPDDNDYYPDKPETFDPAAAIVKLRKWIAEQCVCGTHPDIQKALQTMARCVGKVEETVKILNGEMEQEEQAPNISFSKCTWHTNKAGEEA